MAIKVKTRFKQFAIGTLIAALGAGTYVIAAVTFSDFTTGTTISSSEMNTKLNALKDAANALEASVTCPANTVDRFTDNGDGTVCDRDTGLMWEQKLAADGTEGGNCNNAAQFNRSIRCVNNTYTWSATGNEPDGTLFTDFLARKNQGENVSADGLSITQAGYTDWRIPNIVELRNILLAQFPNCPSSPCIDGTFGPTQASNYWSSSAFASNPIAAWVVLFVSGNVILVDKFEVGHARAVRGGR